MRGKKRIWTHGITDGSSVEILRDGKPSRPRQSETVYRLGRAGFTTEDHPGIAHWLKNEGKTWRPWAPRGQDNADENSLGNPKSTAA